jgi:hypothetical protein
MNIIRMDVAFRVEASEPDPEDFDRFLDAVADEFYAIRNAELDYGGSLAEYKVTFMLEVTGDLDLDSVTTALNNLRTAIHAAGGSTPGWPTEHLILGSSVEPCLAGA